MSTVKRIWSEKRKGFDVECRHILADLTANLHIPNLEGLRLLIRYDVEGLGEDGFMAAIPTVFSEPALDTVYLGELPPYEGQLFAVEYLPGQYDQRADSASQCIQMLTHAKRPTIRCAKAYIIIGEISNSDMDKIKKYIINPVDSHEASLKLPSTLDIVWEEPSDVIIYHGFIDNTDAEIEKMRIELGLAMSTLDLIFIRDYFKTQDRNPTETEIRVIDTYWSDHCRHTTFLTCIDELTIDDSIYLEGAKTAWQEYQSAREDLYKGRLDEKTICLMDIATIAMKLLKKRGILNDLDISEEINACSIKVPIIVDGKMQDYLVMFKNETHNHPTEIEPFGGAATCLGGAIRDPLSGRSYVYQAMRVTGAGDPRKPIEDTIKGKLPQRKITTGAAHGYSSYGNQIGIATGQVVEIYHHGYHAKRMEIGAVVGAAPKQNVVRELPTKGDVVVLLGGRTGRDGCGGATGSSKEHDISSIDTCGAEVQKGNPPTERKIQRLFRNPKASTLIKRCNDFGAGGVCVAIGELSDSLIIELDNVPRKYEGLNGTELAISESQERMAVVLDKRDVERFMELAAQENLEAVRVATITDDGKMVMMWRGKKIMDVNRSFLDTNGVTQHAKAHITAPTEYSNDTDNMVITQNTYLDLLKRLNTASQRGLSERFDSTIGAGTVIMPFAGKYQQTPTQAMAAKIPVLGGDTDNCTVMTFGFDAQLSSWSPFHGGVYAVTESLARLACAGGDIKSARLTFQEFFEKLRDVPSRWGKPTAALLGALWAQLRYDTAAIGGKDSMSGSFEELDVPPTLVSFAVSVEKSNKIISAELKKAGSKLILINTPLDDGLLPDTEIFKKNCDALTQSIASGDILAAHTVGSDGIAAVVAKMAIGNRMGVMLNTDVDMITPKHFAIVAELRDNGNIDCPYSVLGVVDSTEHIKINDVSLSIIKAANTLQGVFEGIFPIKTEQGSEKLECNLYLKGSKKTYSGSIVKPRVFIPVFPGTNCEYDSAQAFERAGAIVKIGIVKNLAPKDIDETLAYFAREISKAQIVMLPGGFSAGDEPEGSGKFIATTFRSPRLMAAIDELLYKRDGLMLGICNGFQALIKLGLLPYGRISPMNESSPTLTFNEIGRHQSRIISTKVVSNLSPWLNILPVGHINTVPISHGEGKFICSGEDYEKMEAAGQIATRYVNMDGNPTMNIDYNPNGSFMAVEGITSPDGRILGKMAHNERWTKDTFRNVPGDYDSKIFLSGVRYFK